MRTGQLDRPIEIRQLIIRRGAAGGEDRSWGLFAKAWAAVEDLGGSEAVEGKPTQRSTAARRRFRVRWIAGVHGAMRIVYAGQEHDITAVAEGRGRARELLIDAEVRDGASRPGGGA
jgi:head-tail adaptor